MNLQISVNMINTWKYIARQSHDVSAFRIAQAALYTSNDVGDTGRCCQYVIKNNKHEEPLIIR